MSSQRPFDVVALDSVMTDIVLKVDHLPTHGDKVMADFVGNLSGGPSANFACAAARLGSRVASLSTVGTDQNGQRLISDFEAFGVVTDFVQVDEQANSQFTVILIEPSGERSIIVPRRSRPIYSAELLQTVFSQTRALHAFAPNPARFLRMAEIAHAHDVLIQIDIEANDTSERSDLEQILRVADIASFNEHGLVNASGEVATIDGARKLLAFGPQVVVVTLAEKGVLAVSADEAIQLPAHTVDVQDTTGAGDTFNAAFLSATLWGYSLPERLRFANAAAAIAVTGLGPRGHLPTKDEVETFLFEPEVRS